MSSILLSADLTSLIKYMPGHDSISILPIKVATRCSIVSSSNDLLDPVEQKDWLHSTAIARRAVVVPMEVDISTLPKGEWPDSEADCLDFPLTTLG